MNPKRMLNEFLKGERRENERALCLIIFLNNYGVVSMKLKNV
jgi:hypothetical protein